MARNIAIVPFHVLASEGAHLLGGLAAAGLALSECFGSSVCGIHQLDMCVLLLFAWPYKQDVCSFCPITAAP